MARQRTLVSGDPSFDRQDAKAPTDRASHLHLGVLAPWRSVLPLAVTVAVTFAGVVAAAAASIPPALEAIAQKTRAIRSLEVEMVQTKEMSVFGETIVSKGSLTFARPNRLRMDLRGPSATTLIITGDEMVTHYEALGKTERANLARDPRARAVAEHLFMLLDADPEALAGVYSLEVLAAAPLRIRLVPKPPALAKLIDHVEARFDARGFVDHMLLVESNGDRTTWEFFDPHLNRTVPERRFTLD